MKINKISATVPKIKQAVRQVSAKLEKSLGAGDTFQLSRPQYPIANRLPRPKRELEERLQCWITKHPDEIALPNDPLAIFITATQKTVNPHLADHEFHQMMQECSLQGVLDIQGMNDAIDMAQDYLSINHPSSRKMAASALEMLKANPKLTPKELKKSILEAGEQGPAKPARRVAEFLDEVSREIPGFTSRQAARALSLAARGKINWYGMEKSLQIIRGKVQESE